MGCTGAFTGRSFFSRTGCRAGAGDVLTGGGSQQDQVVAVHVLTHETMHMVGITNEAQTECAAVQRDAQMAVALGASPAEAQALVSVDYRDLQATYDTVTAGATGEFLEQYTTSWKNQVEIFKQAESISTGEVRAAARLGATGPNQLKAYLRAGMGPCQGRLCGATLSALIAETRGTTPESVGTLRPRAPYKPLTVAELAGQGPAAACVRT